MSRLLRYVHFERIPGPWSSIGVHLDWQAPLLTVYLHRWCVTFGEPYEDR